MRFLITFFVLVLAACSTTNGGARSATLVAQSFAEYYVQFIPPDVEIIHVIPETSEAALIALWLQSASRRLVVKTDRKFRETKSEVVDVATGKRCIVLRLSSEAIHDAKTSVTVSCSDGSWTQMTYFLSFEGGAWRVTGSRFIAAS